MRTVGVLVCALVLFGTCAATAQGYWPEPLPRGPAPEVRQAQEWIRDQRWRHELDFQRQQDRMARERDLQRLERGLQARGRAREAQQERLGLRRGRGVGM